MATTGGNLLQRTRCYYFRDTSYPCNKREPGSGCSAIQATTASTPCSARATSASPRTRRTCASRWRRSTRWSASQGPTGERSVPLDDFYIPYGDDPAKENVLEHGELITAVDLPAVAVLQAVALLEGARPRVVRIRPQRRPRSRSTCEGGTIREARVALGGVATKPWRATAAEKVLDGQQAADEVFAAAAEAELKPAVPADVQRVQDRTVQADGRPALQTVAAMTEDARGTHAVFDQPTTQTSAHCDPTRDSDDRPDSCPPQRAAERPRGRHRSIGRPVDRVDGRAKVTGARQVRRRLPGAERRPRRGVHEPIASGRVTAIDSRRRRTAAGRVAVLTRREPTQDASS